MYLSRAADSGGRARRRNSLSFFVSTCLKYIRRSFSRSGNSLLDRSFERGLLDVYGLLCICAYVCACVYIRVSERKPAAHCIQSGIAKQLPEAMRRQLRPGMASHYCRASQSVRLSGEKIIQTIHIHIDSVCLSGCVDAFVRQRQVKKNH